MKTRDKQGTKERKVYRKQTGTPTLTPTLVKDSHGSKKTYCIQGQDTDKERKEGSERGRKGEGGEGGNTVTIQKMRNIFEI